MGLRGAKAGWTFGGLGGLLWIPLLGILMLTQGRIAGGLTALAVFAAGAVFLLACPPWKHAGMPVRRYYGILVLFLLAGAVVLLAFWGGGRFLKAKALPFLVYFLPLFIPVFVFGRKTWSDLHGPGEGA